LVGDTFLAGPSHVQRVERAGVSACRVSSCRHNQAFECTADLVRFDTVNDGIECATFSES
jgi:hypothetical protein